MESCELIPGRGIRRGDIDVFFGMRRKALRDALGYTAGGDGMWDDEDEYASTDGTDWLVLRFLDDRLCDIEVRGGSLVHEGIELKNTLMPTLRADLERKGMALEKTEWLSEGHDCVDLQIVVAAESDIDDYSDDTGDKIAWVIASSDFKVE
ncbi:hypothetical protein P3W24_14515 [Luteibacter sp. PPL201]|jgi:hypothetical protein|uniref:DUF4265 domain-containing protein n=1 Tax=Luteibacter sahnii TaxID=3021977 RepID=A0ABT6BDM1_9GAMM